jgi:phospholipase/lecithinase/hemolysin
MIGIAELAAAILCLAGTSFGTPIHPDLSSRSRCRATSSYLPPPPRGDSYTTPSFNVSGVQPAGGGPLGNPQPNGPGYTSSNGPNWVDFLTTKYNESLLLTYNLAYGGATVDSALVAPYLPTVLSVSQQVENEFFPNYASSPASAPWKATDTLFGIFIGINDVGNSYWRGSAATKILNDEIFAVYEGLMEMLYNIGARNFLFLNVPPVDRSPLTMGQGTASQVAEKADIEDFNNRISGLAGTLKERHGDVNVFAVDTYELFTDVLDKPSSYAQTALYKNTTAYCSAYAK